MASSSPFFLSFVLVTLSYSILLSHQQQLLSPPEQDSVYAVLTSINPTIPWRTLFPDDLCLSAPHGVVCDYFINEPISQNTTTTAHITELSFGFVSDFTPNPPCSSNSTLNPLLFSSFKYLRKLFFYKCFIETGKPLSVPDISGSGFGENLEELVFIENPGLVGPLSSILGNFSNLRRLVLSGNGVYGNIPDGIGDLLNLEELTLSRNQLKGTVPVSVAKLNRLRVLDLSQNHFDGNVPESIGFLPQLLKLDLSSNGFFGKIPDGLGNLKNLEFLDLSFNHFGNFGVPVFIGEMPRLRDVYFSGNLLGGQIPEIWENLGGISGIGFSDMGLVGKIPASMGVFLRNLCYLRLDDNKLEGKVPEELGFLEFVNEINLENNNLSGKIPFSANFTAKMGEKLKLKGNSRLCISEDIGHAGKNEKLQLCNKSNISNPALYKESDSVSSLSPSSYSSNGLILLGFCLFLLW